MSHSWWVAVKAIGGGVIYAAVVLMWGARLLAPLVKKTEEEGRVKIKTVPAQLVLSTIHKGPYSEAGMAIGALAEHAYKNNCNFKCR